MDMLSLDIFLKTAEEGNITKTAGLLHLSQPTVSRRIRELEAELNRQLFVRTNKSVTLTDEGRQFLETAKDILMIYEKTLHQTTDQNLLKGDIYICSGEIPAFSILSGQIKEFRKLQPGICFHIRSGNADEIRDGLEKGALDLGLLTRSVNTESFESLEYPGKSHWGVLIRKDHPLTVKKQVHIEDLKEEVLIIPENNVYYRELTNWFSEFPNIAATYTLAHNAVQLVKEGIGPMICFEDSSLVQDGLVFISITPEKWATPLLVWKKRSVQSDAVRAFLEFIQTNRISR